MSFVDIGANLAHDSFDADRDEVIARARDAGVESMIVTGSDYASNAFAVDLARHTPRLAATSGLHPHHAESWDESLAEQIDAAAAENAIVAVGETGLDYFRDLSPRPAQSRAFEAQLDIARRHRMPVFLHQREAHADFRDVLAGVVDELPGAIVHCFTGDRAELEAYLALGCHIGVTGWICDERRGRSVAELLSEIPGDRLMIETDCPYLLPRNLQPRPRTRRNEPAFLPAIAEVAAVARGQSVAELAAQTSATAAAFFGLTEVGEARGKC